MPMKLQGTSLVGHVFNVDVPDSLPSFVFRMPVSQRGPWAEAQTERYRVIEECSRCGRALTEGEQIPHRMSHEEAKVASAAMTAIQRGPETARAVARLILEVLGEG